MRQSTGSWDATCSSGYDKKGSLMKVYRTAVDTCASNMNGKRKRCLNLEHYLLERLCMDDKSLILV